MCRARGAPLSGSHAWQVLIEATTADPQMHVVGRVRAAAWGRLATEAHRRCRCRCERGAGRSLLEDPRFHFGSGARRRPDARARHLRRGGRHAARSSPTRRPRSNKRSRASSPAASGILAMATSISTFAPGRHAAPDWYDREGLAITRYGRRPGDAARWLDLGRTWHWTAQARGIWTARAAGAGPCFAGHQTGARSTRDHEPGETNPLIRNCF